MDIETKEKGKAKRETGMEKEDMVSF